MNLSDIFLETKYAFEIYIQTKKMPQNLWKNVVFLYIKF